MIIGNSIAERTHGDTSATTRAPSALIRQTESIAGLRREPTDEGGVSKGIEGQLICACRKQVPVFRAIASMNAPPKITAALTSADLIPAKALSAPVAHGPVRFAAAEREITRLTWAVLDGSASLADRQRLGDLVKAQHAARHRPS
jgi:hypothetical protein